VITDSACDLDDGDVAELGITVVPLTIRFGSDEYVDRTELSTEDFWTKLQSSPVLPETAAPSVGAFEEAFRALHEDGVFVIPNPWDAGSATMLATLGFPALASTSSGFAFTLGRRDGGATLDEVVAHAGALDRATALPVSVDLENGYGSRPEDAALAITRVAEAGAVGASIEDYDPAGGLYPADFAAERVAAAVAAARALDFPFMLTARAENHIRDNPVLDDTIARLRLYQEAGADVLYAPGLADVEQIRALERVPCGHRGLDQPGPVDAAVLDLVDVRGVPDVGAARGLVPLHGAAHGRLRARACAWACRVAGCTSSGSILRE